ncbi:hypothetical protein VTJ49DRAFT_1437 [Mycothermus thermophilus]|uniref:Uncharacterized protein n=1 Tax=Humicola insolens TaxID=85995 RepID=A0ABR3VCB5_HUMIN
MSPIGGAYLSALDANAIFLGDNNANTNPDMSSQSEKQLDEQQQPQLLHPVPQQTWSSSWWSTTTSWLFSSPTGNDTSISSYNTYNTTTTSAAPTTLRDHAISVLNPTQQQQHQHQQPEQYQDWSQQQQPQPPPAYSAYPPSTPGLLGAKEAQVTVTDPTVPAEVANHFAAVQAAENRRLQRRLKRRAGVDVLLLVAALGFLVWKVGGGLFALAGRGVDGEGEWE